MAIKPIIKTTGKKDYSFPLLMYNPLRQEVVLFTSYGRYVNLDTGVITTYCDDLLASIWEPFEGILELRNE